RRRHTRWPRDWSSDVCSSDLSFKFTLRIKSLSVCYSFHFFGSFCFNSSTGAKRSPIFSTRDNVLADRNFSESAFFFFRQFATSRSEERRVGKDCRFG